MNTARQTRHAISAALLICLGCSDIVGIAISSPQEAGDSTGTLHNTDETVLTPVPISFDNNGWISKEDNALGIQGAWDLFAGESSVITGIYENGDTVYTEGTATPSPQGDDYYITYYGAKIGFYLCANAPPDDAGFEAYTAGECPYNEDLAEQIAGVAVTIEGELPTTELRLQFNEEDRIDGTYKVLEGAGRHTALLSEAKIYYDLSAEPVHVEAINMILFFISSAGGPTDFDFRIKEVEFLTYP